MFTETVSVTDEAGKAENSQGDPRVRTRLNKPHRKQKQYKQQKTVA